MTKELKPCPGAGGVMADNELYGLSLKEQATFFLQNTTGSNVPVGIDTVVQWSMTRRGGHQFDLLAYTAPPTSHVCIYAGGLCE